ncbi:hypothetical protein F8161_24330 [Bacillus cereus]|uniref:hypothetical protein n=1 Tax=Bacillus cereus TaxID=1396 RepID=UPI00124C2A97|nr:hypothetical protein [Bacillus cereus]KAB2456638.1 hypothetical protein F8161_24330 [Bacillus cereus]
MGNQYLDEKIKMLNLEMEQLAKNVSDLQRNNDGLVQTVSVMSESIDGLKRAINHLNSLLDLKVTKGSILSAIEQEEKLKKA